jgi:aldose 1-epimerase
LAASYSGGLFFWELQGDPNAIWAVSSYAAKNRLKTKHGYTMRHIKLFLLTTLLGLTACSQLSHRAPVASGLSASRTGFGTLSNGADVDAVTLKNAHGMSVTLISFGATVQSLRFPDKHGSVADLAVGYDTLAGYETTPGFTNVTVGRYANRIANGNLVLDGQKYALSLSEPPNTLHGGSIGWDKRNWTVKTVEQTADKVSVTFTLTSPDGDQGFPGTVVADVKYELDNNNDLSVSYGATTDKPTVVNLTYHSMLNLSGIPAKNLATDAELTIESDAFLPVNEVLIPTGQPLPVAGTPFDFRTPAGVTQRARATHPQLALANGGIDHNYIIRGGKTATPKPAVTFEERQSGRGLKIATTEPGMQVYTGNFLDGQIVGKAGQRLTKHQSISFEAQGYPDSPNQPAYPSTRLDPGQAYAQTTVFHFYLLP